MPGASRPSDQLSLTEDSPDDDRRGLLAACQAGDRMAFAKLFRQNSRRVYRWAVLLGLSAHDAEDAAQEALATAARRIADCRSEAVLTAWLFQITRRVVANLRRSGWMRRMFRAAPMDDSTVAFERTSDEDVERELAVRRCFARLTAAQAEVLILSDVEECPRSEVALVLGISEGTVASRLRLARDAFRRQWEAGSVGAERSS